MLVHIAVLMKPEKVAYIKHISGMERGTALREEISSSGSKNDEEERIVGSETLSTCEQSLFFFRFSESRARARESGAFSHARGHLPVSRFAPRTTDRGTQREILRKRPKNSNKAWIKLSKAILSMLGVCWEKFICSSLPARLTEEFPASKVHLQPLQTDLPGSFLTNACPDSY